MTNEFRAFVCNQDRLHTERIKNKKSLTGRIALSVLLIFCVVGVALAQTPPTKMDKAPVAVVSDKKVDAPKEVTVPKAEMFELKAALLERDVVFAQQRDAQQQAIAQLKETAEYRKLEDAAKAKSAKIEELYLAMCKTAGVDAAKYQPDFDGLKLRLKEDPKKP